MKRNDKNILNRIPEKILIIKPSSLGDIVHSLPFLNVLRESFPKSEIHWIVARGLEGLLEGHPMINKLRVINKDDWKKIKNVKVTVQELRDLFDSLKKERFDLVIDLQGLLRSGVMAAATRAPIRIGFSEAREGSRIFYTHKIAGGREIHAVDRYLKIAEALGCDISEVCFPFPLFVKDSFFILHSLSSREEYAVIVPGARWQTKRWQPERFGEMASKLPVKFFVVGGKSDIETAERVVKNSDGRAVSIAGKTGIKELIEVMRRAMFVVSNDSGPMHIAAALDVPVFAIFGPTNPKRTGPYGDGHTIIRQELGCSPCYKKTCKNIRCMDMINADMAVDIIKNKTSQK